MANNAIENLKRAFKSQAITSDTHSLQNYVAANKDKKSGLAEMTITGLESKFVVSNKLDAGEGFYTRFFLANGETVGTFSNGAHQFLKFYAGLMGDSGEEKFLKYEIQGHIDVTVTVIDLGDKKSTYEFDLVDGDIAGITSGHMTAAEVFGQLPEAEPVAAGKAKPGHGPDDTVFPGEDDESK